MDLERWKAERGKIQEREGNEEGKERFIVKIAILLMMEGSRQPLRD